MTDAADIASLPFEKALQELEEIVAKLEKGAVSLDDSVKLYERGEALKKTLRSAAEGGRGADREDRPRRRRRAEGDHAAGRGVRGVTARTLIRPRFAGATFSRAAGEGIHGKRLVQFQFLISKKKKALLLPLCGRRWPREARSDEGPWATMQQSKMGCPAGAPAPAAAGGGASSRSTLPAYSDCARPSGA